MRAKAEWVIDSEAMRARGIIVFSKIQLKKKVEFDRPGARSPE